MELILEHQLVALHSDFSQLIHSQRLLPNSFSRCHAAWDFFLYLPFVDFLVGYRHEQMAVRST